MSFSAKELSPMADHYLAAHREELMVKARPLAVEILIKRR
jgi:hypothetical protein